MKIKTKGNQEFNVPNNDEGRKFIADLRRYANGNLHVRPKGRATNRTMRGGNKQDISYKSDVDWIAVYLRRPEGKYKRLVGTGRALAHPTKPKPQGVTESMDKYLAR